MQHQPIALAAAVGLILSLAACGQHPRDQGGATEAAAAAPTAAADMTADQAIAFMRSLAEQGSLKTTVSTSSVVTTSQRVRCSDTEVATLQSSYPNNKEIWPCKSSSGGDGPYFKTMPVTDTESKTKQVPIPASANWSANGPDSDGKWLVKADFGVEGQPHHAEWTLDQKTHTWGEGPGVK